MRRTAVVRARCEPRRPRRQANGGDTAGRWIRSTSTAAMRMPADHHTNDHLLSRGHALTLALGPGARDVARDQGGRALAVARGEGVVDGAVVADGPLQEAPRGGAREQRAGVAVPVDGA